MEYKEMTVDDVPEVVSFIISWHILLKMRLAMSILILICRETGLEKYLLESIGSLMPSLCSKENGKAIAFISGEVRDCCLPISIVRKVGYINGAFVLPGYRRQGVMKKLESMLLEYFKRQGLSYIELNVITGNLLGKRSWESLGYKTFREQMRKKI